MATEKRLIDANVALLNTYNEVFWTESEAAAVRSFLVQQKTVDAVEVVRCKDCKHRADALDCGNYLCNRKMLGMVRPNDFCSFGERKDNG